MQHNTTTIRKHKNSAIYAMLLIGFVYTIHDALPVYINSSFLGLFTTTQTIGLIYTVGSLFTILGLLVIGRVIERFGNYRTVCTLIIVQMVLMFGLMTSSWLPIIIICFVLSMGLLALIGINLDIFLQKYSDTNHTGGIRGLYLTAINTAWVLSPLIAGALIFGTQYRLVYVASFVTLFLLLYLIEKNFYHFKDAKYGHFPLEETLRYIFRKKDYRKLFSANIILNVFYSWMVIYSPIYLHETLGFGWDQIGIILTIMLLPFVIFELPVGKLADAGWGEKRIMTGGFILIAISTAALAFITSKSVFVWAIALFITRIGAAIAESMIEIYFFKKAKPEDADVLGMFRITRPISYIIAPAITALGLLVMNDYKYIFIVLGVLVLFAIRYTTTLTDIVE